MSRVLTCQYNYTSENNTQSSVYTSEKGVHNLVYTFDQHPLPPKKKKKKRKERKVCVCVRVCSGGGGGGGGGACAYGSTHLHVKMVDGHGGVAADGVEKHRAEGRRDGILADLCKVQDNKNNNGIDCRFMLIWVRRDRLCHGE